MIFDIANRLGAVAVAAGCILGPAVAQAQTANEAAGQKSEAAAQQAEQAAETQAVAPNAESSDAADDKAAGQGDTAAGSKASQAGTQNDAASAGDAPAKAAAPGASVAAEGAAAQGGEAAEAPAQLSREEIAVRVKAAFEKEFPGISLDSVKPTRFADIYELRIGTDLLYTNDAVEYVLQGSLIDAHNKEDLTAKSLDELTRVAFDSLPLESAIKQVKGDGSRKMVVFEDPNCGYCKRLHQTLEGMDNYTIYTLLFPILSPDSTVKARNIWCAGDRAQAWRNVMLKNQAPPNAQCETPIEANLALGRKLLVRGTPAIIFEDGSRVNGALPKDALEARLDAATVAAAVKG